MVASNLSFTRALLATNFKATLALRGAFVDRDRDGSGLQFHEIVDKNDPRSATRITINRDDAALDQFFALTAL